MRCALWWGGVHTPPRPAKMILTTDKLRGKIRAWFSRCSCFFSPFGTEIGMPCIFVNRRVAEVVRGHGGPPPKSLDSDENFKPEHTLFCRKLRFVAIYALFLEIFGHKKGLFWVKTVLLWQEVHYYMVYIAYCTDSNLQICYYTQKPRICRENGKYVLDESFYDHFCPWRKAANFCHPKLKKDKRQKILPENC